jgi:hypothetical protein
MALQPTLEIREELGYQIHKARPGDAGSPVGQRRAWRSALPRIIRIGKAGAHRGAKQVGPIERRSARIETGDKGAADRISDARSQFMRFAPAPVAGVLMKRGGEHEISKKILANDIGDRRSEALGVCGGPGVASIERSGLGYLRHAGVECARAKREGRYCFALKILPLLGGGGRSQRHARGVLRERCRRDQNN